MDAPYVRECAVIGAADKARGRIVKAYVVLAEQAIPAEPTVRDCPRRNPARSSASGSSSRLPEGFARHSAPGAEEPGADMADQSVDLPGDLIALNTRLWPRGRGVSMSPARGRSAGG
ncbi:AMP-binding enzyme [Rhizobium sp. C1]|uniref:AMP-binding enzyme n=1 Tax=Rhizobium sp. C1 TaxID=1349799 RepID=UPI003FA7EE49